MGKYIKMIVVLVAISSVSGFILGPLHAVTSPRAQLNQLKRKKIPAVLSILKGDLSRLSENERQSLEKELLADKKELTAGGGEEPEMIFVLKKDGRPYAVAFEQKGKGYGGEVGVMAGFNLATGALEGIGIGTMSETPGVGTRIKEEAFTMQFRGLGRNARLKLKKDGGDIDAVTGATRSSRAAANAVNKARAFYDEHEAEIKKLVESGAGGSP